MGVNNLNVELLIQHNGELFAPIVEEGIEWSTERKGSPGQLTFKVVYDGVVDFAEGDRVRLKVDDDEIFYGFIFTLKRDKDQIISITAYDQLRYLKNKDTYVYKNKTAGEVVQMIAADFNLQVGEIENTGFKIASRVEDNSALFDIIQNALDLTLQNQNKMFVLFDKFGKITLKSLENMKVDVLIDEETGENFEYSSSIDSETYNKIKLTYENEETGKRDIYIAQHGQNINDWGVLQHTDTLKEGENGQVKANALLKLYNHKTKNLSIKNAFGSTKVRAGSMIPVILDLGDFKVQNMMLVEKCKHEFKESQHFMDLTLRGGDFVA